MARIQFDISYREKIESGEYKVVTDCGEPVEVVKWDCKGKCPILAVIDDGDTHDSCFYHTDGSSYSGKENIYIITPKPELTEFDNMVRIIIQECLMHESTNDFGSMSFGVSIDDKTAQVIGSRIWKLAQCKAGDDLQRQFDSGAVHAGSYNIGYKKGREDALKEMPKWRKQITEWDSTTEHLYKGYYIDLEELYKKLPKEE